MDAFSKLAPFIQDFIYQNNWEELRSIQVEAINAILDTDCNLLLSSGTASGKTEACFLPTLTYIHNRKINSVSILYISPLKALINDQFKRLDDLLKESNILVTKWHGDASNSKKNALIKNPSGLLQITPESLESLVTNKPGTTIKLFKELKFVIIDEVHHFMRDARGIQVLSILERIQRLTNNIPRRIGLSATLGELSYAVNWLNTSTSRTCITPLSNSSKKKVKLYVERFEKSLTDNLMSDFSQTHFEYLYKMTLDKKTLLFTNSREEAEFIIANLKQIALLNKSPDVYRVHHGNISGLLREQTEDEMKEGNENLVVSATVTLELGIDIGSLDQVVQVGSPINVSSFAQRLGRCGRRGQTSQILFTIIDEVNPTVFDILGPINWSMIRLISIIELYIKLKWVEPIYPHNHPYSILYHQVMSYLKSNGEVSSKKLASDLLTLSVFKNIDLEDFKTLLLHLIEIDHIQKTELDGLIIGRVGENIVNHFHFLTVFEISEYYLVKDENRAIGTVDKIYPQGTRFSLAGLTWETVEVNEKAKVIFVKNIPGISVVDWDIDFENELHTTLVRKIREILLNEDNYPYISPGCLERVNHMRYIARNSGILFKLWTKTSNFKYTIFPWVGTRQLLTLHYCLLGYGIKSTMPYKTSVYLEVIYKGEEEDLENIIYEIMNSKINLYTLPLPPKIQIKNKYNEYIPSKLLKKQFIEDFLDLEGLQEGLRWIINQNS